MLSCFFYIKKKKNAKGLDRMVLTGSCGPTPVLGVHRINKKSGYLGLKNRFSSRFSVSWSDLSVRSGSENHGNESIWDKKMCKNVGLEILI